MHCLDVRVELQAYVDGELSPERATLLEQHVAACGDCREALARMQTVVAALETWPLAVEPADLTTRVMADVRSRPALPAFRLRWSDFAISLGGSGLALVAVLAWRYLSTADKAHLRYMQLVMWLEMARLKALLAIRALIGSGAMSWGLLLGGVTFIAGLAAILWHATRDLTEWERETLVG
jgi:anti-sigma factor RsiW